MSWMHDRVNTSRSRRQSSQGQPELASFAVATGAPRAHVAIPRILGRRARWMTLSGQAPEAAQPTRAFGPSAVNQSRARVATPIIGTRNLVSTSLPLRLISTIS
jgi:hypothetical protein